MNWYFFIAAVFSFLTALIHVFFGGKGVDAIIQATKTLSIDIRTISQIIWHSVTINFTMMGGVCLIYSFTSPDIVLVNYLLIQILAFSGLFIYYNITKFGSLFRHFQWIIFLIIGALIFLGANNVLA